MNSFLSRLSALLVLGLAGGGLLHPTQAQLQKIEQTVFGMDCAPCAHAMEQSLGAMEGVETVSVSLNDGLATIELTDTNSVAYTGIRKTVNNGGFSPRDATLEVRGTVQQEKGQWILKTPAGEEYVLQPGQEGTSGKSSLQDLEPHQRVTVTGQIPESPETIGERWMVRVAGVQPAA